MSPGPNFVEVARIGDAVLFRIHGLGNMLTSPAIWGLAERMLEEGISKFAFELSDCTGLDSTFVGMLVGLSQRIKLLEQGGWICLTNPPPRVRQSLEVLGASRFVNTRSGFPFDEIEMQRLDVEAVSPQKRLEVIRRAHRALVEIDTENREKFREILERLEAEMQEGS